MRPWRRSLAALLCLCLLAPPAGWAPLLHAQQAPQVKEKITAKQAIAYLDAHGAFKDNPALRQYVGSDNYLTPLGAVLYNYLQKQANPDEEMQGLQDSFKALTKNGGFTDKKGAAYQDALQRYMQKFGNLPGDKFTQELKKYTDQSGHLSELPGASDEDSFALGTLREAMITGASVIDAPKAQFKQIDLGPGQGWEFWDKDGMAFKLNQNQVTVYNRQLQQMQHELNKTRPMQAPFVPETGRYNHEMFALSYWRLKLQDDQLQLATKLDRMVLMAELLGEQKKDQVFFDPHDPGKVNAEFEAELTKKAKAKKYSHQGKEYSIYDIAVAKTKVRDAYLTKAEGGITYFRGQMESFKGATSITDSQVKSMEMGEQYVMRYLSLAFLEAQKYAVRGQLERINPDSSDSAMVEQGIKGMVLDAAAKARYKAQGEALRKRLEGLLDILGRVEDVLCKTDYASSLDLAQAALNSSQKQIAEVGSNYELFTAAPAMLLALQQQSGGWLPRRNGSWLPWNWSIDQVFHQAAAKAHLAGSDYSQGIKDLNKALPAYQDVARLISNGDYFGARKAIIQLNPNAVFENPTMSLNGETAKVNDAARLAAALKSTRDSIAQISSTNRWVDTAGNLVAWSVSVGVGAPVMSKVLSFAEVRTAEAADALGALKLESWYTQAPRWAAVKTLELISALSQQTRLRLDSLEPAQERLEGRALLGEYVRHSACRAVTFAQRQGVFTLMSGGISGTVTALGDLADRSPIKLNLGIVKLGEGNSNFSGFFDAFGQGFTGGVYWANDSFHPMLGYIGLPSSYFEGGFMANVTETLGSRGAVGSAGVVAKAGVGWVAERSPWVAKVSQSAGKAFTSLSEGWAARAEGSQVLTRTGEMAQLIWGTADGLAKYMGFSYLVGKGSTSLYRWTHFDQPNVEQHGVSEDEKQALQDTPPEVIAGLERQIKASEHAGSVLADSPLWLLIPIFPAKYEVAAQSFQRSAQGEQEYTKAGKDALLANAEGDQGTLPMLGKNKPPWMQRIFNFTYKGARDTQTNFVVTKEIKRKAIGRELKRFVSGGDAEAGLGKAELDAFLKISRSQSSDRNQPGYRERIGELFNTDDVRNEARKQCVLALVQDQALAERVLSAQAGSEVKGFGRVTPQAQREVAAMMLEEVPKGMRVSAKVRDLSKGFISRYLEANNLGKEGGPAEALLTASAAITHETPEQAKAFQEFVAGLNKDVADWGKQIDAKKTDKPYAVLAGELRKKAEAAQLTPEQAAALSKMFDLIDKMEARFQAFNNVETTHQLVSEELSALKVQYESKPGVRKLLDSFDSKLAGWRDKVPQGERKTTVADAAPFRSLIGDFNRAISEAKASRSITPEEAAILHDVVNRDMKGCPYILHDSKGTALGGWRPGQFVTYFDSLTKVVEGRGAGIRAFERLTTGGGKTLLTFEGLMPIAEADARLEGKGRKVAFFTVQSNLDAQAQLEWRSLRKVGSEIEFDTYEGLKSKIAEAKNKGQNYVQNVWILGDEMDGAALQPALTLGETTGAITRHNSVYNRLEQLGDRAEVLLQRGAAELSEKVQVQARQAQSVLDGLDVRTVESNAARAATEKLLKAAEDLAAADSPEARTRATQAVDQHLSELKAALESPSLPGSSLIFEKNRQVREALKDAQGDASAAKLEKVRSLLAEQQKLLGSQELGANEQAKSLRRSTAQLLKSLSHPPEDGSLLTQLSDGLQAQQDILDATTRIPEGQKGQIQTAAKRIEELLKPGAGADAEARSRDFKEVRENLAYQKNLLPLVGGDPQARVEGLRAQARSLRESAEARVETLQRKLAKASPAQKTALESELRLARGEAELARSFEGNQFARAQGLIEKIFEIEQQPPGQKREARLSAARQQLEESRRSLTPEQGASLAGYQQDVQRLYDVGRRMAAVDDQVLDATRAGQATEPFRRQLETLQAEADGVQASLARARQQARSAPTKADLKAADALFGENSKQIDSLLGKDDAESQALALRLLQGRKALLEAYAGFENPEYALFRKMKADAYVVAHSPIWERDSARTSRGAAAKAKEILSKGAEESAQAAGAVHELAGTGESAELRQQAETLLRRQAESWGQLAQSDPESAESCRANAARIKELQQQVSVLDAQVLEASRTGAKTEALQAQRDALKVEIDTTQDAFEESLRDAVVKHLGRVRDQAALNAGERAKFLKALQAREPGLDPVFVARLKAALGDGAQAETRLTRTVSSGEKSVSYVESLMQNAGMSQREAIKVYDRRVTDLTRSYAKQMMKAVLTDPLMPADQRNMLFSKALSSWIWPKGLTGRGMSWVRGEFLNLVRGYFDDYATVRMDNITHKTNVIHNGQWFETMDNPTRRFWELEYGTDITLPYTHKALSTIKDVTASKSTRMFALSATAGEKYVAHLKQSEISVAGQGAMKPANVGVDVRQGETGQYASVSEALRRGQQGSLDLVSVRPGEVLSPEANAPPEARVFLESKGYAKKDALVFDMNEVENPVARDFFSKLRSRQPDSTCLTVISLADTRALKAIRNYLIKTGQAKAEEIAQVFSDTEYLRLNRPQANVAEQMNLSGMKSGKVKVLLLDTRVGGRGLDLDYKGDKGDPRPDAFKGYTNYEMLIMDPNKMSAVHLLQAEGRIDVGRVLLGASRKFSLVVDVQTLQKDATFMDMYRNSDFFINLRNDPAVQEFARQQSREVDWPLIDQYIGAKAKSDPALLERYNQLISENLDRKQQLIEEDQLRQSSVLQDKPISDPKLRWLDQIQMGR